jgi:hypothetical protein
MEEDIEGAANEWKREASSNMGGGGEGGTCILPWTRVENSLVLTA